MRHILLIPPGSFLKRDYDRFGIEILKKFFSVKIIDLTPWLYPDISKIYSKQIYQCDEYIPISNKEDFLNSISEINSPIVIDRMQIDRKTHWVRSELKKKQSFFVDLSLNKAPEKKKDILSRINMLFSSLHKPKELFYKIFKFIEKNYYNSKKFLPDLIICGGLDALNKSNLKMKIHAHSMDYDHYLEIKKKNISNHLSYAVFLDEDMVSHTDYILNNVKSPDNKDSYYSLLVKYLKKFEKELNLPVHIAIHPKVSKNNLINLPNLLKGIKYSVGNTAELVKNSSVVLLHCSNSVSFAVLFEKPTVFLTSNKLKKSWVGSRIENFSNLIGGRLINMNEEIDKGFNISNLYEINFKKYKYYKEQYLKVPNSPERSIWEIFSEYILKNNEVINEKK